MDNITGLAPNEFVAFNNNESVNGAIVSESESLMLHTSYWHELKFQTLSNQTYLASGLGILLSSNQLGSGRTFVLSGTPSPESFQVSPLNVVLANIISSSQISGGSSPIWYGGTSSTIFYSLKGSNSNQTLLIIANTGSTNATVSLNVEGSYFGLGNHWTFFDVSGMSSYDGSGSVVVMNRTLPALSFDAIYLENTPTDLVLEYSSVPLQRELVYAGQSLYTLQGYVNQSVLVAIRSDVGVSSVSLNDNVNLKEVRSLLALSSSQQGYFYNSASQTLVIKYLAAGADSVRVLQSSATQTLRIGITASEMLFLLGAFAVSEIVIVIYLRIYRRNDKRDWTYRRAHADEKSAD